MSVPCLFTRSIPAWAGETPAKTPAAVYVEVYPRVGGGNYKYAHLSHLFTGLSPRGRGKPTDERIAIRNNGSIPAWAGETSA